MVRLRFTTQVRYGEYAGFFKNLERLHEIAAARGWAEATLWVPLAGAVNELIAELDYPDLATFEQENKARSSDKEWTETYRHSSEYMVEGTARFDILLTAQPLT